MKRIISMLLCVVLCLSGLNITVHGKAPKKYVKSISIKKKATVTIPFDAATQTVSYKVTVKTKGKVSKKFTVKSSKKDVATVKVSGKKVKVTARKAGTTKITVKTKAKGKKKKLLKKVLTLTVVKQASKAELAGYYMDLFYNSIADSRLLGDGHAEVIDFIDHANANAKYTAEVADKTIADTTVDAKGSQIIFAKKIGKTTARIYEKAGTSERTLVGTVEVAVHDEDMASVVSQMLSDADYDGMKNIYIKMNLGKPSHDLDAQIKNFLIDNKRFGSKFKESDFQIKYDLETGGDYLTFSENGVITGIKNGVGEIASEITFVDGTDYTIGSEVYVSGKAIEKVPGYTLENIREHVIGLDSLVELEDGSERPQVHFNNAATTLELQYVRDTIDEKMKMYSAIERSASQKSSYSTAIYNNTRDKVLEFLSADPELYTCFYTESTTDGLNKLASALITSKDDVVLTTRIEHHANDLSWRERCKVIYAEVDDKGRVIYSDLERLLKTNKVKIVSITAASNVTGYVSDVHRVAKLAHKYGAKLVVDGAQIVAHRKFSMVGDLDDPDDNVDFFAFSAHKMYSPEGGGAVVGLTSELNKHRPQFYGGGTIKVVGDDWVVYKEAPEVYEAGSPDYPAVVGLGAAIDCLSTIGMDNIESHEKILNRKLIDNLKTLNNVIIYGDTENIEDKTGVVTFNFTDINTEYVSERLAMLAGIDTRRGAFCAHPYVWRLMGVTDEEARGFESCTDANTAGMVRISFAIYSIEDEIDYFMDNMPEVMNQARQKTNENHVEPAY